MKILDTGIIYRNPAPHVKSIHAYFPSIDRISDKELVGTIVLGEAFEAANLRSYFVNSHDGGTTWKIRGKICVDDNTRTIMSDACRLKVLRGKEILVFLVRHDRTAHPNKGLTNEKNLGFVTTFLYTVRSKDGGKNWEEPIKIKPPLTGPCFELCSSPVPLDNGNILLPTSTWRGWDGYCPNGMKAVAFISYDNGQTWPDYTDVMKDPLGKIIFWESKIAQLSDGRLLAVAWTYNEKKGKDLQNHYAVSIDYGKTWSKPMPTGIWGQTPAILPLDAGEVLFVYRRVDKPGLWANVCLIKNGKWINRMELPLWGWESRGLIKMGKNMAVNFQGLRFGAPCIVGLQSDVVMVAFWCYEDFVSNVRWIKIKI